MTSYSLTLNCIHAESNYVQYVWDPTWCCWRCPCNTWACKSWLNCRLLLLRNWSVLLWTVLHCNCLTWDSVRCFSSTTLSRLSQFPSPKTGSNDIMCWRAVKQQSINESIEFDRSVESPSAKSTADCELWLCEDYWIEIGSSSIYLFTIRPILVVILLSCSICTNLLCVTFSAVYLVSTVLNDYLLYLLPA